jgi:hypothetical protein
VKNLGFYESFNLVYPKIISAITELSNVIFTLLRNLITTIFIPVILVLVVAVEIPRVQSGIALFDNNPTHSNFSAIVIVLSFIVYQTLDHFVKEREGYIRKPIWNLKVFALNLLYRIGVGEKRYVPQSSKYSFVSGLLKWGIIIISFIGTMQPQIVATGEEVWYTAIVKVFLNSNLETFTGWIVGLIFTFMLVYASGTLAYHIAATASEALKEIQIRGKIIENNIRRHTMLTPEQFGRMIRSRKIRHFKYLDDDKFSYDETGNIAIFYDSINETELEFSLNESADKARLFKYLNENRGLENNSD